GGDSPAALSGGTGAGFALCGAGVGAGGAAASGGFSSVIGAGGGGGAACVTGACSTGRCAAGGGTCATGGGGGAAAGARLAASSDCNRASSAFFSSSSRLDSASCPSRSCTCPCSRLTSAPLEAPGVAPTEADSDGVTSFSRPACSPEEAVGAPPLERQAAY